MYDLMALALAAFGIFVGGVLVGRSFRRVEAYERGWRDRWTYPERAERMQPPGNSAGA